MALPDTIKSAPLVRGHNPPHKSSGGDYYVVTIHDGSGAHGPRVSWSSDPGTVSWTESSSNSGTSSPVASCASVSDGSFIYIVTIDDGAILRAHRFDMGTDTWDISGSIIANLSGMDAPAATALWCSIALRGATNDEVVYAACGEVDSNMGNDYQRVDYWHGEDGADPLTVSGPVSIDASVTARNETQPILATGTNDGIHFAWGTGASTTTSDGHGKTLDSSNSFSTIQDTTGPNTSIALASSNMVSYDDAGTQRIAWIRKNAVDRYLASEDGSDDMGTITNDFNSVSPGPATGEDTIYWGLVADGSDLHLIYPSAASEDLYHTTSDDNGDTWSTAEEILDNVSADFINLAILDSGVIAYTYEDLSSTKYGELSLGIVLTLPTITLIKDVTTTVGCTTNTGTGTLYYYISTSATPPSAADLKAGTGAVTSGSQATPGEGVEKFVATGLTHNTTYYAHFIQNDTEDSNILTSPSFTTLQNAVLTLPTEADITDTTVTVGCTTDLAVGVLYYYIGTSATAPSKTDLKLGTGADAAGFIVSPGIGIETFAATGLTQSTTYYTYFYQEQTGTSGSDILESGSWATIAGATTTPKTLTPSATGTASLTKELTFARTLASSALGTTSLAKALDLARVFTHSGFGTVGLAKTIGAVKGVGAAGAVTLATGKLAELVIGIAATGSLVLTTGTTYARTLLANAIGAVSLTKTFVTTLSISGTGVASLVKRLELSHLLTYTALGNSALTTAFTKLRTFTPSAAGTVSLIKGLELSKILTIGATGTASLENIIGKVLSSSAIGTVSLTVLSTFARLLLYGALGTAVATTITTHYLTLVLSAIGTATVGTVKIVNTIFRTLVHAAVGTVSLAKTVVKSPIPITATGTPSLSKFGMMIRALSHTGSGTVSYIKNVGKILPITGVGTPTISGVKYFYRTFIPSAVGTVSLTKGLEFFKTLSHNAIGTASLVVGKCYALALSIAATGTSALSAVTAVVTFKTLTHSATGTPLLSKFAEFPRSFSISGTGTASLSKFGLMLRQFSHSAIGTAASALTLCYNKVLTYTATGTSLLTIVEDTKVLLTAAATGTVSLVKKVVKYLTPTATGTIVLSKTASNDSVYNATGTVTLLACKVTPLTLSSTAVGASALTPTFVPGTGIVDAPDIRRIAHTIGIGL